MHLEKIAQKLLLRDLKEIQVHKVQKVTKGHRVFKVTLV